MTVRPRAGGGDDTGARLRVVRPPEDDQGQRPRSRERPGPGATVSEVLKAINPVDRAAMMVAFEAGNTYYVEYAAGRFVGVNTDALPQLECEQQAGDFRLGRIIERSTADEYGNRGTGRAGRKTRKRRAAAGGADEQA